MSFVKFYSFTQALAEKVHDFANDDIKVALTNTAPSLLNTVFADIVEIAAGNGYTAGGESAVLSVSEQTNGFYKYVHEDVDFIGSGGSIGPFRWVVFYNATASNMEVIGFLDVGSEKTIVDGETFPISKNESGLFTFG